MEVVYATFSDFNFAAIFIYAPAKQDQNHEFWQEFILYVNSISFPYIIIGDFNEIGSSQDKMGGGVCFTIARTAILSNLFAQINCIEIPFMGTRFTWRKKKRWRP